MIQPTGSVGIRRHADLAPHVLARPQLELRSRSSLLRERLERRVELPHPARQPDGALLDDADLEPREAVEDAVEDHRRQRLHRRIRDRHVVDRAEVLGAAVEVGDRRQAVLEVVRVEQPPAAADVEARSACPPPGPAPRPGRDRRGSASGRAGRPTRPAAPCSPSRSPPRPSRARARSRRAARSRPRAAGGRPSRSRPWRGCVRAPGRRRSRGRRRARRASRYWLRNVLKTSWLEKPSRSSARGRSSLTNEPIALQFLRSMISASAARSLRRIRVPARGARR